MKLAARVSLALSTLLGRGVEARGSEGLTRDDVGGALGWFGPSSQPPRRGTRELLAAFKQSPPLRALVERISSEVAGTQWRLYSGVDREGRAVRRRDVQGLSGWRQRQRALRALAARGELVEITNHPLIDLMSDPMRDAPPAVRLSGLQAMMVTQSGLDLVGSVGWMLQRNAAGMPVEAWPIPDSFIAEIPTKARPTYRIRLGSRDWEVPDSEVVLFKVPDPSNPYARGTGIGATLADEVETFEYASKHLKTWFYNRAMPAGFIGVEGAKQPELEAAKAKFENEQRGFWNAWRVHWHSGKLNWQPVQQTFEQQQMSTLRKDERDIALQTFGVPPEIFGVLENANRSTIDSADYFMQRFVVEPRLEQLRDTLQWRLAPEFDERLIVEFDSPVEEDRAFLLKLIQACPWAFSTNEIRAVGEMAPDKDPEADKLPERPKAGAAAGNAASGGAVTVDDDESKPAKESKTSGE